MSDAETDGPQREIERLKAELARTESEVEGLKAELAPTKKVQDDLWSHEIYLKARRKMTAGVFLVLGILSSLGLFTVYDMYTTLLKFTQGKMKQFVEASIEEGVTTLIEQKKSEVNTKILDLENVREQAGRKFNALIDETKADVENRIESLMMRAQEFERRASTLIEETEKNVNAKIAQLENSAQKAQKESKAYSVQVRQFKLAASAPEHPVQGETELPQVSVDCDPHNLDHRQIALLGVKQQSERTAKVASNRKPYFSNAYFLDVRGRDDQAVSSPVASCILDGVDRVVYKLSPKWYRPSVFVRIDRENNFRFSVGGWGPTQLTVEVYLVGKRDFIGYCGNILDKDLKPGDYLSRGIASPQGTICRTPGERAGPI